MRLFLCFCRWNIHKKHYSQPNRPFPHFKEAKRSELVIGSCKTSRKYGGRATSSLFVNFPFENGSATLPMAFYMLAFVSNRGKLKKSWRIKGEMT
jgi:hypothetical protein